MRTTEDRVIIRPLPKDDVSLGGIIIPEDAKGKPTKAEVLLIGDDPKIKCKPGDKIMFPENAGTDFNWNGVDQKVIRWVDIHMIFERSDREPAAQEIIAESNEAIVAVKGTIGAGTSGEKLELFINGKPFYLQGNVLIPVVASEAPVAPITVETALAGGGNGKSSVASVIREMNERQDL